ncbi:endonuclease/exonuclease/phosphatase family protein [Brevundimonas sp.]|uniref:endonuclease/exonuclease/phosphatase family protein n=1 Tax=Brevundimonas sp. TaxID=1871086 RepID=UPI002BC3021E|nr:endonuclease/exonuclease/phosphatase family protein [Brevundimonas sp.]HWQ87893.1 endonuclease/exonuclease/phosphatase family protein [Brevundimonas sp.]
MAPVKDMFWITGAIILLAALPALLNIRTAPLELLANLRPQVIVLCIAFGCAALTVGRYLPAGVAAVLVAVLLATTPELFSRVPPPVAQPALTIVWCNVFRTDDVVARLAVLARKEAADLIILADPPNDSARTRQALSEYPFVYGAMDPDEHGAVIFSRSPLTGRPRPDLPPGVYPVSIIDTGEIRIVAMHPPVALTPSRLRASNLMMAAAVQEATAGPTLVIGDMNATPWSDRLRLLSSTLVRLSPALGSTWFSSLPVLGLPIDHAFVTPDLRASARVGPGVGSDHLPLIVSIQQPAVVGPGPGHRPAA